MTGKGKGTTRATRIGLIAVAAFAVVVLLAPTMTASVDLLQWKRAGDRSKHIDVIYTADGEPAGVAAELARFAKTADLDFRLRLVADAPALLAAIRAATGERVLVIAHGATALPSDESGVMVGGRAVGRAALLDAVERSRATTFYFAACGLGLPAEVAGKKVISYESPIDVKIAQLSLTFEALSAYSDETLATLTPQIEGVRTAAAKEDLLALVLAPDHPLEKDYYCQDHVCDHSAVEEDEAVKKNQAEGGIFAKVSSSLIGKITKWGNDHVQLCWQNKSVSGNRVVNGCPGAPRYYDFYGRLNFSSCPGGVKVVDIGRLVFPQYAKIIDAIKKVPHVHLETDTGAIRLCGNVWLGLLRGQAEVGGLLQVEFAVNVALRLCIKDDFGCVDVGAFTAKFIGPLTVLASPADEKARKINLDFGFSLKFVWEARLGHAKRGGEYQLFDWTRRVTINNPFYKVNGQPNSGAAVTSMEPIGDTINQMRVDLAWINGMKADPALVARLSAATGSDARQMQSGTILDLTDNAIFDALYPEESRGAATEPECTEAAAEVGPSQPIADAIVGKSAATVCVDVGPDEDADGVPDHGSVGYDASSSGHSAGKALEAALPGYNIASMTSPTVICQQAAKALAVDQYLNQCREVYMGPGAVALFSGRGEASVKSNGRVDWSWGNREEGFKVGAFTSVCAGMKDGTDTENPTGSAECLTISSAGVTEMDFDILEQVLADPVAYSFNEVTNPLVNRVDALSIVDDLAGWACGLTSPCPS